MVAESTNELEPECQPPPQQMPSELELPCEHMPVVPNPAKRLQKGDCKASIPPLFCFSS